MASEWSEWAAQVTGINYYPDYTTLKPLTAAAEDAKKIAGHLKKYGYRPFRVSCLPGTVNQKGESKIDCQGVVRVQELREAIANLFNPPPRNPVPETALFFFSGHGWCKTIDGKEEVFLATSDALPNEEIYGISLSWLGEQLQTSQAKRVVVWLDCCYGGELVNNYTPTNKDYCIVTATRSYETGAEIPHTQGLLTQTLLEGLNPENDPDGIINSHKLADFIISRMPYTVQRPLIANSPRAILLTTKFSQKSFQDKCPYRSLSYFSETKEDAEVFYGRSGLTKQLIQQVRNQRRLVAVLGASGSGKSSLLRAGLLYQLKLGQEIPGSHGWTYITPFTPRENPVESLREAFSQITPLNPPLESRETGKSNSLPLARGGLGRGDFVTMGKELKALNTPVILIIDQLEECFTMSDDSQRQEFFDCLRELIDCTDNLYIFIGMRSDFRGRLREHPKFAGKIHKPYINVEHLNRQEIEEAITKPADLVGLGIEGRLKQQLINDVEDYPGSLPLLQYTLTELWRESRNQGDEVLSLKTYEALGGVEGTLQKRADEVFDSLLPTEQIVARRLFLELTQIGESTDIRRRVRLRELVNSHHSLEVLQQVSEKLADKDARLITKTDEPDSHDVILDVVHEALIRHWEKLRDWKEEYKVGIAVERQIEAEAQEWETNERKEGFLRQDDRLAVAEDYLARFGDWQMLNGLAEEYIEKSRKLSNDRVEEEKKRTNQLETALAQAQLREQSTRVLYLLRKQEFNEALKLAIQTIEKNLCVSKELQIALLTPVQQTLYQAMTEIPNIINQKIEECKKKINTNKADMYTASNKSKIRITSDARLFTLNKDKKELLYLEASNLSELSNRRFKAYIFELIIDDEPLKGHTGEVKSIAFSPDGQYIVSGSSDNTIILRDKKSKKIIHILKEHTGEVKSVAFSLDGQYIASGSSDNTISLWKIEGTPKKIKHINSFSQGENSKHKGYVNCVAFGPYTELYLVSGSDDETVRLWDKQGQLIGEPFFGHRGEVASVAFSPNGKYIVSGSADKTVRLWNIKGKLMRDPWQHDDNVTSVAFSPDGKYIVSGSADKTVRLWNLEGKKQLAFKDEHDSTVTSVAFSPDGQSIVSADNSGKMRLLDLDGNLICEYLELYNTNPIFSVAFSPDGETIITGGKDTFLYLWLGGYKAWLKVLQKFQSEWMD
ncbi:eIF2A-related protein [Nostoc sp. FACHB-145]|uniref:nSTAND1 domain-containing NTPase n=1 Tax=Nostoc sp. FACHB-145 TaxID=2692836 RepID=UPI001684FD9C|nr:caspase family protein [Nostoc sp. FACHB-145]MBD2467861.1 caspase family protein [Nostoc sp. FACHB-145]